VLYQALFPPTSLNLTVGVASLERGEMFELVSKFPDQHKGILPCGHKISALLEYFWRYYPITNVSL